VPPKLVRYASRPASAPLTFERRQKVAILVGAGALNATGRGFIAIAEKLGAGVAKSTAWESGVARRFAVGDRINRSVGTKPAMT